MNLNRNEEIILEKIKKNPYISQQALAKEVSLSRPAVANIISRLIRKNYLLGRAYLVNESSPIICIGGANIDNWYQLSASFQSNTTNPTTTVQQPGGVARNIAENLGRLEQDVELLSIVGEDSEWQKIEKASKSFMGVKNVESLSNSTTGKYIEIKDEKNRTKAKLSEDTIYEKMSIEWLIKHKTVVKKAETIIVDLNCPKETIEYLQRTVQNEKPLLIVSVSNDKAEHLPENLSGTHLFIAAEDIVPLEETTGQTTFDLQKAGQRYLEKGAESVVIFQNYQKVLVVQKGKQAILSEFKNSLLSAPYLSGVKEAFYAGIVYSHSKKETVAENLKTGYLNAFHTAYSKENVRTELTKSQLIKEAAELAEDTTILTLLLEEEKLAEINNLSFYKPPTKEKQHGNQTNFKELVKWKK
ncbi:MAG: PfkB family carbohydrate kinase [Pisciglobus halotolerans]|nr:PfkB family carbohydrate kinase [Pisciglobus halotolerans]